MFQHSFVAHNIADVDVFLSTSQIKEQVSKSKSVLVQVFTAKLDEVFLKQLNTSIKQKIPHAVIVGATSAGEITAGKTIHKCTVLSFSFFEESDLNIIVMDCKMGSELETGTQLIKRIKKVSFQIKGVLILGTTLTMSGGTLLEGIKDKIGDIPLFGAGAGSYDHKLTAHIFHEEQIYTEGIIAVVLSGANLHIEIFSYVGWQALSKEMTITEISNSLLVKKIDGVPAAAIYEKYLGITNDDKFFTNVIEFPFMLQRDGFELARIPVGLGDDGSIYFISDIKEGEKVRLAYGNPENIISNAYRVRQEMKQFSPQGIMLYTCNCRQVFLQEAVQMETQPFETIAPTTGFFTYGEFYGKGNNVNLLNATMVAVGMREGPIRENKRSCEAMQGDGHEPRHIELATRLAHFIDAVVSDLEDANAELQALSYTDKLTELYNRGKIDSLFKSEIDSVKKNKTNLSVILMDIDHFKSINDLHGHHAGDNVLKRIADILKSNIRSNDLVGRWGGEEFMIILRDTDPVTAGMMADRIREVISRENFGSMGKITASFGVVGVYKNEEDMQVYKRVDAALYLAKNNGRNMVVNG